jgi:hypothetical protein
MLKINNNKMSNENEKKRIMIEISNDVNYKEELEMISQETNLLLNLIETRRFLYNIGEYQLEEGEIIG